MLFEFALSSDNSQPLHRQLYQQVRALILSGKLPPGTKLPPSRVWASELGVARATLKMALDQLQTEGYLVRRIGSGTYVTDGLPQRPLSTPNASPLPRLSAWGNRLLQRGAAPQATSSRTSKKSLDLEIDFGFARPFAGLFPYDVWRRLLSRYLSTDDALLSRYGSVAGFGPLREAIAGYITSQRGVTCRAEQVVIVNGVQQALDILARLLLNPHDEVLVETPGYTNAYKVFQVFGTRLTPVPVDDKGFNPERIPQRSRARLVFVTPSNQFPYGGAMPVERQLALYHWALEHNSFIIEDDYDGELRYDGFPLSCMQSLDQNGRVIYLGTFSKVLFPALRLGYVVLPPALLNPFLRAKQLMDRGAPTLTQAAVADFIQEGHFERHVRQLRRVYGQQRKVLVRAIETHLDQTITYGRNPAGLHLMLRFPSGYSEAEIVQRAAAAGVGVYGGAAYFVQPEPPPTILLGFSGLTETQIEDGVARLAQVVAEIG